VTITHESGISSAEREVRESARKRARSLSFLAGFGNEHSSEALPGALPVGQNQPQRPAYGTYVELLSVTGFVETRQNTRRSWLYRILPSAVHDPFTRIDNGNLLTPPFTDVPLEPNHQYWEPRPAPPAGTDFVDGLWTLGGNGSPAERIGSAIHLYTANTSMTDRVFGNADGELLIVPEQGGLLIHTELGLLSVEPGFIALIPRAIKFRVEILGAEADGDELEFVRGYVIENYGTPFILPERIQPLDRDLRSFAAGRRRLAWQRCSLRLQPRALPDVGSAQLRPRRSVTVHRTDFHDPHTRCEQHRLRGPGPTLDRPRAHISPRVLPPKREH